MTTGRVSTANTDARWSSYVSLSPEVSPQAAVGFRDGTGAWFAEVAGNNAMIRVEVEQDVISHLGGDGIGLETQPALADLDRVPRSLGKGRHNCCQAHQGRDVDF